MKKKDNKYAEEYKSPEWQKKRLQILERDNWTCQHCGARDKQLHVHHTVYAPGHLPWQYPNNALVTLCETCHKAAHENPLNIDADFFSVVHREHTCDRGVVWYIAIAAALGKFKINDLRNLYLNMYKDDPMECEECFEEWVSMVKELQPHKKNEKG